ncbi:MAG: PrsW family intramembrane metalloprotease [Candidatus Staskawiczbacteria bacterium]|nr:PrsW family intramembrane metalloprotease [Candidatus Staskawiczbacteria bacterium]
MIFLGEGRNIIVYIFFGILPSLVWLSYYLRKDVHPEPKRMILKIFLWGILITIPVFFVQIGLKFLLDKTNISSLNYELIYWFLIIALSEEFFKYLVIRLKVINSPNLDEPLDIMLYMVIAALGFAALENILYLFTPDQMSFYQIINRTLVIDFIRFIGATFLHTLCSAVVGYSLAISFCEEKRKYTYVVAGLFVAMVLHGLYNFSIMALDGYIRLIIPVIIILTLAFIVFLGFEKLKKMKSTCKINEINLIKFKKI